jgi:hypothetical protein
MGGISSNLGASVGGISSNLGNQLTSLNPLGLRFVFFWGGLLVQRMVVSRRVDGG